VRIIIDLQGMQTEFSSYRGVGRYTQNLILEILKLNYGLPDTDKHEILLAMNGGLEDHIQRIKNLYSQYIPPNNFIVWSQTFNTGVFSGSKPELIEIGEIIREVFFASFQPDVVFSTNLQEGMHECAVTSVNRLGLPILYATTLHDVVPLFYEDEYLSDEQLRNWYFSKIEASMASDLLFTVSHSAKREICEKLGLDEARVVVAENGYDQRLYRPNKNSNLKNSILNKYGIKKPYVMYFGGSDEHKNLKRLVEAYALLPRDLRQSFDLIMAGKDIAQNAELRALVMSLGISATTRFCGYIAEEDLPVLLNATACFVFPSTHEGFGLPALEAMACGAPVVGSRSSSVEEVIGNSMALFDPYDVNSIAQKIEEVLRDPEQTRRLIDNGLTRAKQYSWRKTAQIITTEIFSAELNVPVEGWSLGNPVEYILKEIIGKTKTLSDLELMKISESISLSFPNNTGKKRVFMDISSVIMEDHKSGIQRVTRAISSELLKLNHNSDEFEFILVYSSSSDLNFYHAFDYTKSTINAKPKTQNSFIEFSPGDTLLYLDLHPSMAIAHRDFNISLRNRGIKVYHVVYDILPILKPETFWPELCNEFRAWAETVSVSDGALCISNAVAQELENFIANFGAVRPDPLKIGWFHLGADIENSAPSSGYPSDSAIVLKKMRGAPSFLMVGTVEPRKGHKQTVAAFETLWAKGRDVNLVIVGRLGWGMHDLEQRLLEHPELGRRLFWLAGISDQYLDDIYKACLCLIAASEGEGFGLPLIEAAQRSLPIICRNLPVFQEVAGSCAFYFTDSKDAGVIGEAVDQWLQMKRQREIPLSSGMPWLSWEQSAAQLMALIQGDAWPIEVRGSGAIIPDLSLSHRTNRIKFEGFAAPERHFRWTDGREASLTFDWRYPCANGLLKMEIDTLFHQMQHVEIYLDERKIFAGSVQGAHVQLICIIPDLKQGRNTIVLKLPDARRPSQGDKRLLSLALRTVEIGLEPPLLQLDKVYDCRSEELLFNNWFAAEQSFRWSNGLEADIFLNIPEEGLYSFHITGRSFQDQKVSIAVGGQIIWTGTCSGDDMNIITDAIFMERGLNCLDFDLPDAALPDGDPRMLAFALSSFSAVRSSDIGEAVLHRAEPCLG